MKNYYYWKIEFLYEVKFDIYLNFLSYTYKNYDYRILYQILLSFNNKLMDKTTILSLIIYCNVIN